MELLGFLTAWWLTSKSEGPEGGTWKLQFLMAWVWALTHHHFHHVAQASTEPRFKGRGHRLPPSVRGVSNNGGGGVACSKTTRVRMEVTPRQETTSSPEPPALPQTPDLQPGLANESWSKWPHFLRPALPLPFPAPFTPHTEGPLSVATEAQLAWHLAGKGQPCGTEGLGAQTGEIPRPCQRSLRPPPPHHPRAPSPAFSLPTPGGQRPRQGLGVGAPGSPQ